MNCLIKGKTHAISYSTGFKHTQAFSSVLTCNTNKTIKKNKPLNLFIFKELAQTLKLKISHSRNNSLSSNGNNNSEKKQNPDSDDDFKDKLIKWAIQSNISHISFSKLLKVLSEHGIKNLPSNSYELLRAKEKGIETSSVLPGTYTHFGLETNLKTLVEALIKKNLFNKTEIGISIFIDNLPLMKYSGCSLWVILGSVEGFTNNIFFVGTYQGHSKPKNVNLFLSKFVEEAKHLCTSGLRICDNHYNVRIKRLICDTPAKHFVLNIKDYLGYSSCTKCTTVGEHKGKRICFLGKGTPRTDEDFHRDEMYLGQKTKLLEIPNFGVVSNVPLDYMHLVCLGVLMKLFLIWFDDKKHWTHENALSEITKKLIIMYPSEFKTKVKPLKRFSWQSGRDFRYFLLYTGPLILRKNLKKSYYEHFLLLHVACRLLCIEATSENVERGRNLLNNFVESYRTLYSTEQITYNLHGLYHLADECASHGTLDSFSAFPFEKFLLRLRNTMKKCKKRNFPQIILKDSYDRIFERSLSKLTSHEYKTWRKLKREGGDLLEDYSSYEKLWLKNFEIKPHTVGDRYVLLKNGKIIEVTDVLGKKEKTSESYFVAGKEFTSLLNFYPKPFESFRLDIYYVSKLSEKVEIWPVDMIDKKCMKVITEEKKSVMMALLDENF